jgi:hypothetical protein
MDMRSLLFTFCFALLLAAALPTSAVVKRPALPHIDNGFVQQEFGATCTLLDGVVPLAGDFDGDGVEDIVIPAHCTNPLLDAAENGFNVIDPYNASYGYTDVKITSQYSTEEPSRRGWVLLVIHGSGADAWRAETPKAKFVIINLPFDRVRVRKIQFKKTAAAAIFAEQSGGDRTVSALFWDTKGRTYRYQQMGSGLD